MSFWNFRPEGVYRDEAIRKPAGAAETEPEREEEPEIPDGVLDIDGEIVAEEGWFSGDGAVIARNFRKSLAGYRNVTVRINSPGGDVMAGAEIYSALKEHSLNGHGEVRVEITALAASAASVVAMAGDVIAMYPTSYMMIHNPWTMAVGDAKELRKAARTLDVISEGLINAYQQRTGKSRDELQRMLQNETWMSAGTCVAEGFADEVIGAESGTAAAACLMSGKSHGAREILTRMLGADVEFEERAELIFEDAENPDEEDGEEEERPEKPAETDADEEGAGADPEEEPEENPDDPEKPEEADGAVKDAEEDPEEPEEEPETEETEPDGEERESRKKNILRRAAAICRWAETVVSMTRGGEA